MGASAQVPRAELMVPARLSAPPGLLILSWPPPQPNAAGQVTPWAATPQAAGTPHPEPGCGNSCQQLCLLVGVSPAEKKRTRRDSGRANFTPSRPHSRVSHHHPSPPSPAPPSSVSPLLAAGARTWGPPRCLSTPCLPPAPALRGAPGTSSGHLSKRRARGDAVAAAPRGQDSRGWRAAPLS